MNLKATTFPFILFKFNIDTYNFNARVRSIVFFNKLLNSRLHCLTRSAPSGGKSVYF